MEILACFGALIIFMLGYSIGKNVGFNMGLHKMAATVSLILNPPKDFKGPSFEEFLEAKKHESKKTFTNRN